MEVTQAIVEKGQSDNIEWREKSRFGKVNLKNSLLKISQHFNIKILGIAITILSLFPSINNFCCTLLNKNSVWNRKIQNRNINVTVTTMELKTISNEKAFSLNTLFQIIAWIVILMIVVIIIYKETSDTTNSKQSPAGKNLSVDRRTKKSKVTERRRKIKSKTKKTSKVAIKSKMELKMKTKSQNQVSIGTLKKIKLKMETFLPIRQTILTSRRSAQTCLVSKKSLKSKKVSQLSIEKVSDGDLFQMKSCTKNESALLKTLLILKKYEKSDVELDKKFVEMKTCVLGDGLIMPNASICKNLLYSVCNPNDNLKMATNDSLQKSNQNEN